VKAWGDRRPVAARRAINRQPGNRGFGSWSSFVGRWPSGSATVSLHRGGRRCLIGALSNLRCRHAALWSGHWRLLTIVLARPSSRDHRSRTRCPRTARYRDARPMLRAAFNRHSRHPASRWRHCNFMTSSAQPSWLVWHENDIPALGSALHGIAVQGRAGPRRARDCAARQGTARPAERPVDQFALDHRRIAVSLEPFIRYCARLPALQTFGNNKCVPPKRAIGVTFSRPGMAKPSKLTQATAVDADRAIF
jgi:hypothetical protein